MPTDYRLAVACHALADFLKTSIPTPNATAMTYGARVAHPMLSRRVQPETDGALFWKISSGDTRAGMPSFSYLPAPERWQLVLHLRSLATVR
jgi:hypothetical protein